MRRVQLFARDGTLVATVLCDEHGGIIFWKKRYFVYREGRFVEDIIAEVYPEQTD